ncbi:unnamed protein product [Eretmochelys imbricata]
MEQIQTQLNTLKQERGELLEWKQDAETQSQEYLGKIEAERQKIMSEFEQLRQFLDEQERLLLAQLEELDKEIVKIQDENVTKLSKKISRLGDLISEIEEKCQQPTSVSSQPEFLQIGYSKMENVSKGAEGVYRIQGEMYRKCVAVVNFTVVEPSSFPPTVSGTSGAEEEARDETKKDEPASWNRLLVRGVVAAVGVLVSLYECGFWKGRGKVFAYSRLIFRKLLTHPSQQPGSQQDSQESELPAVCDRDGDQAQGTRNRNRDPALENGEGDLFANSYAVC